LDFFDTEDEQQRVEPEGPARRARREPPARPPSGGGTGGGAHPSRQQIRTRQLTLAAGAIVIVILLALAFRACVDARSERSFQNYVSDLNSLAADTDAVSQTFFEAFNGESESGITLGNEIAGDLGQMQSLLDRAANLDAPDELSEAQSQVVLSYQLRRDAIAEIADKLPAAQGEEGANSAQKNIATQMEVLLASDVLFARAAAQIDAELLEQEVVVDEGVPESEFLPDGKNDPDYLDLATVQSAIAGSGVASGGTENCGDDDGSVHGLELTSTTLGGVVLQPGAANTVPADGAEFEIAVTNQGETPESGIQINISGDLKGSQSIDEIVNGESQTVNIPAQPAPSAGDSGSVTVRVEPVCFEEVDTNNESTYDLTFE
jgi:hypothetical protein